MEDVGTELGARERPVASLTEPSELVEERMRAVGERALGKRPMLAPDPMSMRVEPLNVKAAWRQSRPVP
jgi:hypothetical protein